MLGLSGARRFFHVCHVWVSGPKHFCCFPRPVSGCWIRTRAVGTQSGTRIVHWHYRWPLYLVNHWQNPNVTFSLSIYLRGTLVDSYFGCYEKCFYKHGDEGTPLKSQYSSLWGVYPVVGLMGFGGSLFLVLLSYLHAVLHNGWTNFTSPSTNLSVALSLCFLQDLSLCFEIILKMVRYLIVVWFAFHWWPVRLSIFHIFVGDCVLLRTVKVCYPFCNWIGWFVLECFKLVIYWQY